MLKWDPDRAFNFACSNFGDEEPGFLDETNLDIAQLLH